MDALFTALLLAVVVLVALRAVRFVVRAVALLLLVGLMSHLAPRLAGAMSMGMMLFLIGGGLWVMMRGR